MCLWIVKSITSLKTPERPLYHSTTKKRITKQMMCLWIVKSITSLKTPEGPLYHSTTKKKNYKANEMFVDSKINNKSQNTRILLLLVERFDLYMK